MAKLNKENIAVHVLTSPTYAEAANRSGVSLATLKRLRKDPDFQAVLEQAKKAMFDETMSKAQGYCLEMLEVLRAIATDNVATDASRVSAAKTVLDLGIQLHSMEAIEAEIAELKRGLADEKN